MTARTLALPATIALLAGGGASAALADRDHPEDDGTTTATTQTQTTPSSGAPRIVEGEVDGFSGRRLRLRIETSGRVTSARLTYRGRTYAAQRTTRGWARTVAARGGDHLDDRVVTFRARACNAGRCTTRTFRDEG